MGQSGTGLESIGEITCRWFCHILCGWQVGSLNTRWSGLREERLKWQIDTAKVLGSLGM
jgi:hypothetical protein